MEVTSFELMGIDNWGLWWATGLARMPAVYGIPEKDDIVAFLMDTYSCDQGMATGFTAALRLFWQEEYAASAHLSVPGVEQGIRRLLLLLNEPVCRVEQGKKIGQFPASGLCCPSSSLKASIATGSGSSVRCSSHAAITCGTSSPTASSTASLTRSRRLRAAGRRPDGVGVPCGRRLRRPPDHP